MDDRIENILHRVLEEARETSVAEQSKDQIVDLVMAYFEAFESRLLDGFGYSGDPDVMTVEQVRREARSRHAVAAQLTQAAIAATASRLAT